MKVAGRCQLRLGDLMVGGGGKAFCRYLKCVPGHHHVLIVGLLGGGRCGGRSRRGLGHGEACVRRVLGCSKVMPFCEHSENRCYYTMGGGGRWEGVEHKSVIRRFLASDSTLESLELSPTTSKSPLTLMQNL